MRFVALAVILASLPIFLAWLQSGQKNRDIAMTLLGLFVFTAGSLQIDAAIVSWPQWQGTARGMLISPADTLALALIFTRKRSGKMLPFTWLLVSYIGVLALSILFSRTPMASAFSAWNAARVFVVFLAIGGELARPTAYQALLRGFAVGVMVQAGYVMQQKLSGVVEAAGTMGHRNELGMITELVFLCLLAAMLEGERSWLVRLGAIAALVCVAGGGSRAAMGLVGGGALLLIVLSLIRNQTPQKMAVAAAALAMVLAAVPVAMMTLKGRFGDHSLVTGETVRQSLEESALSMSRDYPFGVGANLYVMVSNTEGYASRAGVPWGGAMRTAPVHNAYLLARAETGYQGQAILILLLLVPTVAGLAHAFRYRRTRADGWALGSAVAVGALAVHSMFEFNTLVYTVQLPLAINIAIIAGRIRAAKIEKTATPAMASMMEDDSTSRKPRVARLPQVPALRVIGERERRS